MKPAALRLVATAVLFVGWIGYLGYLAATARNPVVLSRPQFLVSNLDVTAHRVGQDSFVIDEVLFPADPSAQAEKGQTIVVRNLKECQTWSADGWHAVPPAEGRRVLLALLDAPPAAGAETTQTTKPMEVAPIPLSPGYAPPDSRRTGAGPPRIYPADDDAVGHAVLSQYRTISKLQ